MNPSNNDCWVGGSGVDYEKVANVISGTVPATLDDVPVRLPSAPQCATEVPGQWPVATSPLSYSPYQGPINRLIFTDFSDFLGRLHPRQT